VTPTSFATLQVAYEKFALPNGLEVILVEDHKLPIVAVNLWYHVGPANEAPGLTGFAHLFEHMMFSATKHAPRGLVDQLFEGAGATDSNGSTDFDRTNYYDTLPSNQLELALWAHADRMGYLLDVLDQKALSNQQDVVRNERRQVVENEPYGIVHEAFMQQLFPKSHPYHANIMGSHADIQSAKLGDIRDFFTRFYAPNNASLVIAGDIDKAAARALVTKYFGTFKRGADVAPLVVVTPPITSERRLVVADRVELPRVIMGWLTSPAFTAGDAELAVAAQILSGGKASRLYKSLVYDKQLAQDVGAWQSAYALSSIFSVDVTARPGFSADDVEAAIDAELAALCEHGPTEAEVERARSQIETELLTSVEKIGGDGLADTMNRYNQYVGDPGYLGKDLERYRSVTALDVQRVLNEQLRKESRVVVHGVPGTPVLPAEVPTPPAPKGKRVKSEGINPDEPWRHKVPAPGPAPRISLPVGESFKLANGLTVMHHANHSLPLVAAELIVRSGAGANPAHLPGLADFTASMLDEGTLTRSAPQIADAIAQLGASLDIGSGADTSRASLLALKANFAGTLAIVADLIQHPAFPEIEVERQRASRLGQLSQQREDADATADLAAAAAIYGAGHPFAYGGLGSEDAIRTTSRADMQAFWERHYKPDNAALVVAGDITLDEVKALAEASFGSWKPGAPAAGAQPVANTTPARVVLVDHPGATQTALRVTAPGVARSTPDFAAIEVMNAALGGLFTSRINNNLREEKGYTYGIFSQFDYRRTPGPFEVSGSVRADVTGASVSEIFKEIRDMQATHLPPPELDNARNAQVLSLPGLFDTNHSMASSLASIYVYDLPQDYYCTLAQQFSTVTVEEVQSVARTYLKPESLVVVAVGDRKKIEPQLRKLNLGAFEVRDRDGM